MSFVSKTPPKEPDYSQPSEVEKEAVPEEQSPRQIELDKLIKLLQKEDEYIQVNYQARGSNGTLQPSINPDLEQIKQSEKILEKSRGAEDSNQVHARNLTQRKETILEKFEKDEVISLDQKNPVHNLARIRGKIKEKYGRTKQVRAILKEIDGLIAKYKEYEKIAENQLPTTKELVFISQEIISTTKRINDDIAALKTNEIATKTFTSFIHIAKGKAKHLWKKEGDTKFAYITAVKSIFNTKLTEIRQEIRTAKKIRDILFNKSIDDLFKNNNAKGIGFTVKEKETIRKVLRKPENVVKLKQLSTAVGTEKENLIKDIRSNLTAELRGKFKHLAASEAEKILSPFIKNTKDSQRFLELDNYVLLHYEKVTDPSEKVHGKETYKTYQAENSLENALLENVDFEKLDQQQRELDFKKNAQYGLEILKGIGEIHRAGHVHGDLKLDNFLLFKNEDSQDDATHHVKLADFGKTKPIGEKPLFHTGNNRDGMAVEQKLSKEGEVQSAAFLLVQVLENQLINSEKEGMLVKPDQVDPSKTVRPGSPPRRGIVKFLTSNKLCPQSETVSLRAKVRALTQKISPIPKTYPEAQTEIYKYIGLDKDGNIKKDESGNIDTQEKGLLQALKSNYGIDDSKLIMLGALLRDMNRSDPKGRPTIDDAIGRYEQIGLFA